MSPKSTNKVAAVAMVFLMVTTSLFSGAALAHTASNSTANLSDGGTYWVGQTLEYSIQDNSSYNGTFELYNNETGSFIEQINANNDTVVVGTSDLGQGTYDLEDPNGNVVATFDVYAQSLSVSADSSTVQNDGDNAVTAFTVDSNRASYDVNVTAANLTATEIAHIVDNSSVNNVTYDGDTLVLHGVSDGKIGANFTGVSTDAYTFNFDVRDSDASSSASVTVEDASTGSASFADSIVSVQEGDTTKVVVNLEATSTATLQVGSPDKGYTANVTVQDKNDDGKVTVLFNSYTAGQSGYVGFAVPSDSKDNVSIQDESTISDAPLDQSSYEMSLFVGDRETAIGALSVTSHEKPSATTFTAPGSVARSNLQSNLVQSKDVAAGDYGVIKFDSFAFDGMMGDSITAADLAKGSNFSQAYGIYVTAEEQNPEINTKADKLDISNAEIVKDAESNTAYLVFQHSDFSALEEGDSYDVTLHVNSSNPYVADSDAAFNASSSFNAAERSASFAQSEEPFTFEKSSNGLVTVSGDATVAPGSQLTIAARSDAENAPFIKHKDVTVAEDGTWTATFDFSEYDGEFNFSVQVTDFTERKNAQVVTADAPEEPQEPATYNLSVNVENANGTAIDAAQVTIDGTVGADATLQNGTYTVSASADGYKSASKTVTIDGADKTVTVTLEKKQPTTTQPKDTTTEKPDDTTTEKKDKSTTTDDSDDTTTTTDKPGPGFGVVVALIALAGAALLAGRRQ